MTKQLWLDDLEKSMELRSESRTVTQDDINKFAEAGGDINPLHLDPKYASQRRPFRRIIAHGELAASIISALGAQTIGYESIVLHKLTKTRLLRPLYPGDTVHIKMTVRKIEDHGSTGDVSFDGTLINQKGTAIAIGERELTMFRESERSE